MVSEIAGAEAGMTKFWWVAVLYFSSVGWAMENRELYNLYKQGKYAETEQALQAAVERAPEDLGQHYDLGVVQYRQGKFKEARESFERAKEITDPKAKARALYNLGNAEVKLGNLEGAKKAYQDSLSYDLENNETQENLKWVEEQLKKQPPQQQQNDQQKQDQDQEKQDQGQEKQDQDQEKQDQDQQEQDEAEQRDQDNSKDQEQADDQQKSDQKEDQDKDSERQKDQEKDPKQPNDDQGEKDKQDQSQRGDQSEGSQGAKQKQPTPEEIDRQDAERIIRSIDDQVVPYMYRPEGMPAEKEEESNGSDW
jgi:Ca-activated chloride channel family protein